MALLECFQRRYQRSFKNRGRWFPPGRQIAQGLQPLGQYRQARIGLAGDDFVGRQRRQDGLPSWVVCQLAVACQGQAQTGIHRQLRNRLPECLSQAMFGHCLAQERGGIERRVALHRKVGMNLSRVHPPRLHIRQIVLQRVR